MIQPISLTKEWVAAGLPKRPKDANKGTFGKVLVIAGSENYPGAAFLSCAAAYRVGAGLVTLASIPSVCNFVTKKLPEVTLIPLPEKDGAISEAANQNLTQLGWEGLSNFSEEDVVLLGPGLTKNELVVRFIEKFIKAYDMPILVVDGDGLNALSQIKNWWKEIEEYGIRMVLTPHPGEMSRLTGLSIEEIQKNKEKIARKYAADIWGQTVVLKGAETVIVSPAGEVMISPFANPVLATAGTGDVLSGIIAGFLAQGVVNNYGFNAAAIGVYIHGLAGEMVSKKMGDAGALASDLLPVLPKVIQHIQKQNR